MPRSESTVSHPPGNVTIPTPANRSTGSHRPVLLQDLVIGTAARLGERPALRAGQTLLNYTQLAELVGATASGLLTLGLQRRDRVAIYLPKTVETVAGCFGTALAGGVFVPVNPVLKASQVAHILRDSGARVLITSAGRLAGLMDIVRHLTDLQWIVLTDGLTDGGSPGPRLVAWSDLTAVAAAAAVGHPALDSGLAAIFYTSGSTGLAKGVMLSHRNLVAGAISVAGYLGHQPDDRILSVLPLSFDAGFSDLTTGFLSGAEVTLQDYLLPRDVLRTMEQHRISGITGVPPLWAQLAAAEWPEHTGRSVRYFASTGGVMPRAVVTRLRQAMPAAAPFLMYGLTEAFRSTYLPPAEIDRRPGSIGKAIPGAEIFVLREDGTLCAPEEPGELVHQGPLVSQGYWNQPALTAERFRPLPAGLVAAAQVELAVWSGDTVVRDEDGFLYFRGRRDDMIKSSGYRISPTEVEELVLASGLVAEVVAVGVPEPALGQVVVLMAVARDGIATETPVVSSTTDALLDYCREVMPLYMVPVRVEWRSSLRRNANGKYDRLALRAEAAGDPLP